MNAFSKVIGYDEIKAELERFCDVLKNSEKYESMGVTLPSGILFYGEPGIGKTLMAKSFIEETGCKSYTIRKDKPDGDFTNQIRETFETAKKEPKSIVFLDDMDKFANEDEKHPDAEEYIAVQACIDDSREDNVFVIATINDQDCLPKSLLRTGRFDKIIEMKTPGLEDTIKLTEYYLEKKSVSEDVDAKEIAKIMLGHPISDIRTTINEAGINAGFEGRAVIEKKDILKSIIRLMFKAPECSTQDGEESDIVLVHELGHVVVAEVLEPGSVSLVSVESHNGKVGGVTMIRPSSDNKLTVDLLENKVIWTLGGRAATEIFFGKPDVGSNADLHSAYETIEGIVSEQAINGFETFERMIHYASMMDDRKSIVISNDLEKLYQKAKTIIAENRGLLMALADVLREEKTLTSKEIREVIDSFIELPRSVDVSQFGM